MKISMIGIMHLKPKTISRLVKGEHKNVLAHYQTELGKVQEKITMMRVLKRILKGNFHLE